jgi:mono/diheme cytochrome c family protein
MGRLPILVAAAALACATLTGVVMAATVPDEPAAQRGADIAQARCAQCHAVALEEKSPVRDAPLFRVLSRVYAADRLEMKLLDIAEQGHFEMPRVSLSEEEAADVAAYIASLDGGSVDMPPPGTPTDGAP